MRRLIAHLLGDYVVQSDWMAQTKTKSPLVGNPPVLRSRKLF